MATRDVDYREEMQHGSCAVPSEALLGTVLLNALLLGGNGGKPFDSDAQKGDLVLQLKP